MTNESTAPASAPVPWVDLAAYGLKFFLVSSRGSRERVLVAGGQTERNADALSAFGMRPHSKSGRWHRKFGADEAFRFQAVRDAFPLMQIVQVPRETFVVWTNERVAKLESDAIPTPATSAAPAEQLKRRAGVAGAQEQHSPAERDAARLLHALGLAERIAVIDRDQNLDFIARIDNPPYMQLVIERQPHPTVDANGRHTGEHQRVMFTHYRRQNGDTFIDAEAVFRLNVDGTLTLIETATQNPLMGGEVRRLDRTFGNLLLRNMVTQGFGSGALQRDEEPESVAASDADPAAAAGPVEQRTDKAPPVDTTTTSEPAAAAIEPATLANDDDFASALLDVPQSGRENYRLDEPERVLRSAWNDRMAVEGNLKALRILQGLRRSGDEPSEEDLDALIGYVGWGGLPGVFSEEHALFRSFNEQLRALASDDEYAQMRASTMNAHYTHHQVIDAMWSAALNAGFVGGRVLEPGAGTGMFIARVPDQVKEATRFVAVEKDPATAGVLRMLFPRAKVFAAGFEETAIPDQSIDLVIGNVPFGSFQVFDPDYRKLNAYIHDYFIVKSLDKLRPGGVLMCLTGTGTLDRQNPKVREAMYERGDLVAAFRLPEDAFKSNANTDVTTDLLMIRKRLPGEAPADFDWSDCIVREGVDESSMTMNGIFATSRGHVLGHLVSSKRMYGAVRNSVTRHHPDGGLPRSLSDWLGIIPQHVPAGIHRPLSASEISAAGGDAEPDVRPFFDPRSEGAFAILGSDDVGAVLNGKPTRITGLNGRDEQRIRDYIPLRDAVADLIQAQLSGCDDGELAILQDRLEKAYAAFVEAHGRVAEGRRNKNRRLLQDDPIFDAVHALEVLDDENRFIGKAEIFTTRTIGPRGVVRCESVQDALVACIDQTGGVDAEWIAKHSGKAWDQCVAELSEQVFRDPASGQWDIAARYLSGNVREKLRIAERAAEANSELGANVAALRERLPQWLTKDEISAALGMRWIEPAIIRDFLYHVYDTSPLMAHFDVTFSSVTGGWEVKVPKYQRSETYDTPRMRTYELIEAALNGKSAKVTKPSDEDDKKRVVDEVATAIAIEKQRELKELFARWVWDAPERVKSLETSYNELFNAHRSADYRQIPISVSGMTTTRQLRTHQATGLARCLLDDNVLLAHPVGFGKTATMSATAVKLRQVLGGKSLVVTPKNVIIQFAGEAKRWFPTARILTIRSEDLTPSGRGRFWRRVQVTSPDLILATPEAYKRLRLPKDAEVRFLMDEIAAYGEQVAAVQQEGGNARRVKQMEAQLAGKCAQLTKLMNLDEKDDMRITLADLGVTTLMVDEAHRFKALQVHSSEQILGIPSSASQRAFDMLSKVRFLQENGGKVIFATGSMITNTVAEVFNMQRYLQPGLLEQANVMHFDAWRAQFADTVQSLEPDPAGKGYRIVNRLAEIRNVPELVRMLAQFVDSVPDTNAFFDRPTPNFHTVSVEPTELQQRLRESLAARVEEIRQRSGRKPEKGQDNILCVLGDARRGALDVRTLYPELPEDVGGSKLREVADCVARIHHKTSDRRGAQAIFLDLATPRAGKADISFNAYEALTAKLVDRGIPRDEIAYIHDAKSDVDKLAMYRRVREGTIRVLLGSTEKMGEGANIQDRLAGLHHLNAPFHPGAVTQRNGRIIRNGNQFPEVEIWTYVTKGMLEDWNWRLVTLKANFIAQVMEGLASGNDGAGLVRKIAEDSGTMSFEAIEAEASDNPLVRRKCVVDTEVRRLDLLRMAWGQQRSSRQSRLDLCGSTIDRVERELNVLLNMQAVIDAAMPSRASRHQAAAEAAAARKESEAPKTKALAGPAVEAEEEIAGNGPPFVMTVGSREYASRRDAGNSLLIAATAAAKETYKQVHVLGDFEGLSVVLRTSFNASPYMMLTPKGQATLVPLQTIDISLSPVGMVRRIENGATAIADAIRRGRDTLTRNREEISEVKAAMTERWPHEDALTVLRREQSEINVELAKANESATGLGMQGFVEALAQYGVDAGRKATTLDDFDVQAALADLGEMESLPEADTDDDEAELVEQPQRAASAGRMRH